MDLRAVLAALRATWWLPLVGLFVGGGAAVLYSYTETPLYVSHTQLFVSTTGSGSLDEAFTGSLFSEDRVASYAELLTGESLAKRVVDELGLGDSPDGVAGQIEASVVTDTVLLDVTVTDPSPQRARDIADAVGSEFIGMVEELEGPSEGGAAPVRVTVVDAADLPSSPSYPQTTRNFALAALIGLLVGGGLSVLRARLDRSVRNSEEASSLADAPAIGVILWSEELEKRHTVNRNSNGAAEGYRQLRNNLQFLNVDEPPKVIMVSSAVPSEGKTTVVVNLALALADAGRKVTIVEADLRRPKVTRYMGMVGGAGLTNILAGTADIDDVLQHHGDGQLSVIAAGATPPNPGELLSSSHMFALIEKLRGQNDYVIIDAPPLLPVADATGLAVGMDGVLLCVRFGSTRREQVQQAAAALERVGAKTLGVILNIVPPKAEVATAYGYEYSYETTASNGKHKKDA